MTDQIVNGTPEERILFIDLETTGLDPHFDVPLEVGIVLTDMFGRIINSWKWIVWEDTPEFVVPTNKIRSDPEDFVNKMHTESGLWDDLDAVDEDDLEEEFESRDSLSAHIVKLLKGYRVAEKTLPIAGLSIGSLDRPFLQHHFPILNNFLSHRNIDISSIREICKRINPDLQHAIENSIDDEVTHRAHEDCIYAINLYREYLDSFLYSGD